MESLEKFLAPFLYVIRNHKKTMLLAFTSSLAFAILIFPYDDMSDVFLEAVAKYSQNKVFLQFDNLGIAFFPPSVEMRNVEVEFSNLPTLTAARLNVAPSVASYLAFSHGFTASADGILDGNASITLKAGKKVSDSSDVRKQVLDLEFENFSIKKVMEILRPSFELSGKGNLELSAAIDPSFSDQPQASIEFNAVDFIIISATIPPFPQPTPLNIKMSKLEAKAKLSESNLDIQDVNIGKAGDGIYGKIRGSMGIRFEQRGNQVVPVPTNYNFTVDLNLDKENDQLLGLLLNGLGAGQYQTKTGSGVRYAFKISGANMFDPPKTGPATIGL